MDVRDYEYIVAIADYGNISRAAASLYISQPALTKFLQRTEKQLGVSLFVRRGNQFVPTNAGKIYVEAGRSILDIDSQLGDKLMQEYAIQKQILRIGFSMGRTDEILGKVLPQFYSQYPEIRINAVADSSTNNFTALVRGELDMAMVVLQNHPTGFQMIPLAKSRFCLVVREDDPLVDLAKPLEGKIFPAVSLKDISKARFVVTGKDTTSGKLSRRILGQNKMVDQIALEVSDINSCLTAVEAGLGLGVMLSIPLGLHKLRFLSVKEFETIEQTTSLVYRTDWEPPVSAQYLMRLIKNCE